MDNPATCAFCDIAAGTGPADILAEWPDALAIRPLGGGCTDGHTLVIPRMHVADFSENPGVTATAMARAAELAARLGGDFNLIASKGELATVTVYHLHIHLVPRRAGDGLALPWAA